jgi:hypothetical protein
LYVEFWWSATELERFVTFKSVLLAVFVAAGSLIPASADNWVYVGEGGPVYRDGQGVSPGLVFVDVDSIWPYGDLHLIVYLMRVSDTAGRKSRVLASCEKSSLQFVDNPVIHDPNGFSQHNPGTALDNGLRMACRIAADKWGQAFTYARAQSPCVRIVVASIEKEQRGR